MGIVIALCWFGWGESKSYEQILREDKVLKEIMYEVVYKVLEKEGIVKHINSLEDTIREMINE